MLLFRSYIFQRKRNKQVDRIPKVLDAKGDLFFLSYPHLKTRALGWKDAVGADLCLLPRSQKPPAGTNPTGCSRVEVLAKPKRALKTSWLVLISSKYFSLPF